MMVSSAQRAQRDVIMKGRRRNEVVAVPMPRRNEAFRLLSEKLRKLSEGRPQTPSEVLLRQSREDR